MLDFNPPLLNSANVWATTEAELEAYYRSPYTGAVTIRTSLLDGFHHDDRIHQYRFIDTGTMTILDEGEKAVAKSSLNTLGYSPVSLSRYIDIIKHIQATALAHEANGDKPVIFSVTGTPEEVQQCHELLHQEMHVGISSSWMMEVNLSCPNITGKPPPAYNKEGIICYIRALQNSNSNIPCGIKTPPYTYHSQFQDLIDSLDENVDASGKCPIDFITAVNTLGTCLVPGFFGHDSSDRTDDSSAIGGLGGQALHPLALGNVRKLRGMLNAKPKLRHIAIVGVGGVFDHAGFQRMRDAGASAVAVGTALGIHGVSVFEKILVNRFDDLEGRSQTQGH
ncbi:dihydroorotate dehydrogenase [Ptychographa xylographoides]|nr:dihydroorotate dehydrogenase [Ptychographa xylographoides]